jgi:hypothetical protein
VDWATKGASAAGGREAIVASEEARDSRARDRRAGGTEVSITGENFTGEMEVEFAKHPRLHHELVDLDHPRLSPIEGRLRDRGRERDHTGGVTEDSTRSSARSPMTRR